MKCRIHIPVSDGTLNPMLGRKGNLGAMVTTRGHGSRYEQANRGNVFSYGDTSGVGNSLSSYTHVNGLTATAQPVIGVWNPLGSGKNLSIIRTYISTGFIPAGAGFSILGVYMYLSNYGQARISTGLTPWNTKTLKRSGSVAKAFFATVPLTGMTGTLKVMFEVGLPSFTSGNGNSLFNSNVVDEVRGAITVPPGGLLVVMFHDDTVTYGQNASLLWEENPIT